MRRWQLVSRTLLSNAVLLGLLTTLVPSVMRAADQVFMTITGKVLHGIDGQAGQAKAFGGGDTLDGKPFTLILRFEDLQDTSYFDPPCSGGGVVKSTNIDSNAASEGRPSAILQIGGGSFTYGAFPGALGWSLGRYAAAACGLGTFSSFALGWGESYTGDHSGKSLLGPISLAPTVAFSSGDWRSAVPTVPVTGSWISFYIEVSTGITPTTNAAPLKYAAGQLIPETFTVSGPLPNLPRILRDGSKDITDKTEPVVVGERISLIAALPNGAVFSPPWSVPDKGKTVGGYLFTPPSSPSIPATAPPDFTKNPIDFFWAAPSTPDTFTVEMTCTLSDGSTVNVKTTFDVAAPESPAVTTTLGDAQYYLGNKLSFGNPEIGQVHGITFTASASAFPNGNSGAFEWVQVIDKDNVTSTDTKHGKQDTCTSDDGLDKTNPYGSDTYNNSSSDSPSVPLPSETYIREDREFKARMFLMWDPQLPGGCTRDPLVRTCTSIPVPLGFVAWEFTATAKEGPVPGTWLNPPPQSRSFKPFQPTSEYPHWTGLAGTCSPPQP